MGLLNWKRRSQVITEVVVPAGALYDGTNPHELPMHVAMFVNHALGFSGMYVCEELPYEALLAAHVSGYVGEVSNGGHAQFIGNFEWDAEVRAHVREGLATLGLDDAVRIFADLEAFEAADPGCFDEIGENWAIDIEPFLNSLDDRFFGAVADSIVVANAAWINTRPWLRIIPDADYYQKRGWESPPHPLREARIEARRRKSAPAWKAFYLRLYERLHRDK